MKMKEVALPQNGFENADVMLQCVFDWGNNFGGLALIIEELLMRDDSI